MNQSKDVQVDTVVNQSHSQVRLTSSWDPYQVVWDQVESRYVQISKEVIGDDRRGTPVEVDDKGEPTQDEQTQSDHKGGESQVLSMTHTGKQLRER